MYKRPSQAMISSSNVVFCLINSPNLKDMRYFSPHFDPKQREAEKYSDLSGWNQEICCIFCNKLTEKVNRLSKKWQNTSYLTSPVTQRRCSAISTHTQQTHPRENACFFLNPTLKSQNSLNGQKLYLYCV